MPDLEKVIQSKIRLAVNKLCIMFRMNVGRAWTGNKITRNRNGSITIHDPRPFNSGLPKGVSDLNGWTKVEITKEMVGKVVAIYSAIEVKRPKKKPTKEQQNYIDVVNKAGGFAIVAHSDEEAVILIEEKIKSLSK